MLKANKDERTISGLLLPFGEVGRTNLGKVKVHKGTLRHAPIVTLNEAHDGIPRGLHASLTEQDDGWHGAWRVHEGPEGDALLASVESGKYRMLSVEMPDAVIRQGEVISGTITAAACVEVGAFPSALMAADAGELPDDLPDWYRPSESTSESTEEIVVDGVTYIRKTTNSSTTEVTRKGATTDESEDNENMSNENEGQPLAAEQAASIAPFLQSLLTAAKANQGDEKKNLTAEQAFKGIANHWKKSGNLEAALASVTHDDGDDDGDGVGEIAAAPAWLGEVYKRSPYNRKFVTLVGQGPALTSYKSTGYKITGLPTVAAYAGNLAEVPTGGMTVEAVSYTAKRWAHAANLDRRFSDFGDNEVMEAFTEAQVDSYKRVTDADVLSNLATIATTTTPGTFRDGVPAGLVGIVDAALALIADEFQPTGAIIGADLYRDLLFTKKDDVSAFLTEAFGLEEGGLSGFRIVPTAAAAFAGKTLVLDRSTVRYRELGGGTPVRVEAELISNGGKTLGVFGYASFEQLVDDGVRIVEPLTEAPVEGGGE